jgi:hypothetical protein
MFDILCIFGIPLFHNDLDTSVGPVLEGELRLTGRGIAMNARQRRIDAMWLYDGRAQ